MRSLTSFLVLIFILAGPLSFISCSSQQNTTKGSWITKRKYRQGYHIDWPASGKQVLTERSSPSTTSCLNVPGTAETDTLPSDTNIIQCALMVLRNGEELLVKVQSAKNKQVHYKNCKTLDDSIQRIPKYKVLLIRYPDGSKEIFNEPAPADTTVEDAADTIPEQTSTTPSETSGAGQVEPYSAASALTGVLSLFMYLASFFIPSLGFLLFILALLIGILGGVMGIYGLNQVNKSDRWGAGFAIIGISIAIVEILFVLLTILFIYLLFASL